MLTAHEHKALVEAWAVGDGESAARLAVEHIRETQRDVVEALLSSPSLQSAPAALPIERLDSSQVMRLIPFFDAREVLRAHYCRLDGVYLPPLVLATLVEEAREAGAEFRYATAVRPDELEAETVVIAAGVWSREVGAAVGVSLRVEPLEQGIYLVPPFPGLTPEMPLTIDSGIGWSMREREG